MRVKVISEGKQGTGLVARLAQSGHALVGEDSKEKVDLTLNLTNENLDTQGKYLGHTRWSELLDIDEDYARKVIELAGWPSKPTFTGGINMYLTVWFNGDSTILSYPSILYRRLMAGGCGIDTGCAGSISLFNSLTKKTQETLIKPLEKILKRVSHQGVIHVHVVSGATQFYVKGISAKLYHPLTLAALENTNLVAANVLLKLLDVTSRPMYPLDPFSASVYVSAPPYPYNLGAYMEPVPIKGINGASLRHIWLDDATVGETSTLGSTGAFGHVTARGVTAQEACRRIYKTISNINISDIQYRNDVGKNINTLIESLKIHGWLN